MSSTLNFEIWKCLFCHRLIFGTSNFSCKSHVDTKHYSNSSDVSAYVWHIRKVSRTRKIEHNEWTAKLILGLCY